MDKLKAKLVDAAYAAICETLKQEGWTDTGRCWNEADHLCDGCERFEKAGELIRVDMGCLEEGIHDDIILAGEREACPV